ncbi:MAG TPA: sortase [Candidatus Limnocylindrales bacterium]
MASRPRPPRLRLVPTTIAVVLAAALATQLAGLVIARSAELAAPAAPVASVVAMAAASVLGSALGASDHASPLATGQQAGRAIAGGVLPVAAATVRSEATEPAAATAAEARAAAPKPKPKPKAATHGTGNSKAPIPPRPAKRSVDSFHGRNHVWIPALGISKTIQSFPCSRSRPPDAGVYRWGCAGSNNVYLLSHAWSTFKSLHDAYVAGRLRKGMQVAYADSTGKVRTFRVSWWRVVRPTTAASWAWAPQARSSMTLQTCVGANSEYRLMVRLLQVG